MASLPQRPEALQRASTHDGPASPQETQDNDRRDSLPDLEDVPVLLNPSDSHHPQPSSSNAQIPAKSEQQPHEAAPPAPVEEEEDVRRCWICFEDENEDDHSSEWRSPCPCVLVAHDKCLLEWVDNQRLAHNKILCPQCKSEIKLAVPRSFIVPLMHLLERVKSIALVPGVMVLGTAAATTLLTWIGELHLVSIFGYADALKIMAPLYQAPLLLRQTSTFSSFLRFYEQTWRLRLGLPMIPVALIASRTKISDSILPFIPLIFFTSSDWPTNNTLQLSWPPSAAVTVAMLPYLRKAYNTYYDAVWAPRERRWMQQFRRGALTGPDPEVAAGEGEAIDADPLPREELRNGERVIVEHEFEIDVEFDLFDNWNNGGADNHLADANPPVPIAREPGPEDIRQAAEDIEDMNEAQAMVEALEEDRDAMRAERDALQEEQNAAEEELRDLQAELDDAEADLADAIAERDQLRARQVDAVARLAAAAEAPPGGRRNRRRPDISFGTSNLTDTVLGALIFPSIAAAAGGLLNRFLPKSWVTPPRWGKSTGFLQNRWGRSILGGCLVVVVKDAVMLYAKWRMVQVHLSRRVLDFEGSRGGKGGKERRKERRKETVDGAGVAAGVGVGDRGAREGGV